MRLALVIASDYHQSTQLPTLSRSLEDADRFAAYLDESDLDFSIEELSADRHFSEQFEEALREPGAPLRELIVYFAGYVVTAPGRDPSLILDGDRLGAFALPRLRRLVEETARRALVVIDAVPVAHDGAEPEEIAEAIGAALGRHGAVSVLVNVSQAVDSPLANSAVGTSFTDLVVFCWDTALKSDASETELAGLDVFESMRAEAAFDAFPAARYFPGRVDFDWASGTLESDHEISGLRSTSDEDLAPSGNGLGARPPPLPAFTAQQAAPMAPSAPGVLASPLPIPPEALRAAAASVTFSSVPAVRVPPPPPRSAPPAAPSRSVPPPLPRSAVPPPLPRSAVPPPLSLPTSALPVAPPRSVPPPLPRSTVPPPLPRSAVPPPLSRSAPPPPPAFPVAPPWPDQPSSMLPPPWPEPPPPVTFEREPLPAFQASLVDQEEELTEPGQPFAAIAEETTLPHHGGFGDAEDTEVTGASSALRALDAYFYPADDAAGGESLATPLPLPEAARIAAGALQAEEPHAAAREAAELETSDSDVAALAASDSAAAGLEVEAAGLERAEGEAAQNEAAQLEAAELEAEVAGLERAEGEAAQNEAAELEAAGLERAEGDAAQNEAARSEAGPSDPALAEAVTSSDAALNDLLATEVIQAEAELPAFSDTGSAAASTPEALTLEEALSIESLLRDMPSEPAPEAASPTGAAASEAPPIAGAEPEELPATEAATAEQEQLATAAAPEGRVDDTEREPAFEVAQESAAPNPGRRTLPSDFVTSVLEEAGVVVGDATAGVVTDRLPSVLPPDLVPRTSLETDSGHEALTQAFTEAEVPPRKEPRGALPSDLVERALAEAGVDASELAPRGERDVLEVVDVGEAEALEAREPSYVDEDAPDSAAPFMELERADMMASLPAEEGPDSAPVDADRVSEPAPLPSFASEDESEGEAEAVLANEPMPSFASEDESEGEPALADEPMPSFASEDESEGETVLANEPMPSFASEDESEGEAVLANEPMPSFALEDDSDGSAATRFEPSGAMPSFASEEFADDTDSFAPANVGPSALPPPWVHSSLPPPLPRSPLPPPLVHASLLPPPLVQTSPLPAALPPPLIETPLVGATDLVSRGVLTEGDAEAAFDSGVLELPPFDTFLAHGDVLFSAGDPVGARTEYERALEHAPAARAGVAYERLGAVSRQLGDRDAAVMNYEIALELAPGDAAPLVALTELCLADREFARVEGYQRRYLEGQAEPAARAEVWAAMAELWSEHANDLERYRRTLEQWAEDLPEDPNPAGLLAHSYHQAGDHVAAVETRRRLAERVQDPIRKAGELIEVARDVCGYLRDSDLAVQISLQALELNPGAADAVEIVAALLEHEQRWQELAAIYERIALGMGDRALQLEVGPKLGALYRDKLGAPDRTIAAYERVLERDPGRVDVRRQLAELYSARGEHARALLHCRCALKANPNDHGLYRKVYSLLDKLGEVDAAWNAAMVLDCLGEADINEQLVADAHRPSGLLSPKATVPEEFWGHGLLSPERDRELGEILAAVADAAVEVQASFLRKKKRLPKLTPEARHDLNTSTTTLAKSLLWTSKLLSVKAPELYVLDEVPGDLSAAPSDTPSALVSKSLARGLSLAQLAFLWGRHLTLFRPEHYVAVLYPSVDELVTLVYAALVAGECPAHGEQVASSEVKKLARELRKKLHPGSYARLAAACAAFSPGRLEERVCSWLRAVELTRGRAGLLACGDVAVALELVRRHPVVGQTPQEDQVSDLLCFSVSDEYAKLRGRLGVAIA